MVADSEIVIMKMMSVDSDAGDSYEGVDEEDDDGEFVLIVMGIAGAVVMKMR